ncbi:hypothetical protein [Vibrio gangliei]|uniref:hypothetical protein n=1 Tax=Vibrio gangliei TaxID=2077090 RepID=UPI000D013FFC|nr:hypothetical protein [Vibrio gangliei]
MQWITLRIFYAENLPSKKNFMLDLWVKMIPKLSVEFMSEQAHFLKKTIEKALIFSERFKL